MMELVFPAWAGVILLYSTVMTYKMSVPRMGGGDPALRRRHCRYI